MSKKILVIQTAFIGDAILTLPLIQELKSYFSGSNIDVICTPLTKEIFSSSPAVNNIFVLDKKGKHKNIFKTIQFVKQLKKNNYNKVYSPHRSFRSSLMVFFLNQSKSFGFDNSSMSFIYKNTVKYNKEDHEVKRNLSLLKVYKGNDWKILPKVTFSEAEKEYVSSFITKLCKKKLKVAIAPGSVWETKKYPLEYYIKIIEILLNMDFEIILLGGKHDKELCSSIQSNFSNGVYNAAGKFSIPESIYLLKNTKLLICNDSAPTHMAMAANIPTLTLYCSTTPKFGFTPYNEKSGFLSYDQLECKPCGIHGHSKCPVNTFDCGKKLVPQKVIEKINELLR